MYLSNVWYDTVMEEWAELHVTPPGFYVGWGFACRGRGGGGFKGERAFELIVEAEELEMGIRRLAGC